ncbi:MAG: DegT/DnrJ/EryC1/StrS family aminotransferase [Planctomycetaceae bacterium]|nr:DegT/DnrJ/EryC1/StrS family aminotransferase [Planctomycetaceae bacterium]
MTEQFSRRDFLSASSKAGLAAAIAGVAPTVLVGQAASPDGKPAVLGGTPVSNASLGARWPILQGEEESSLLNVLKSSQWFRGSTNLNMVAKFETEYAKMCGSKTCTATSSGTTALVSSLSALDIGPGDEVITSPYTFIATINSILAHFALPVLVDVDIDSFQVDGKLADAACNENTRCLMPVHIGGNPANLDDFLEVGKKRGIRVIEDACQAHIGEWRGKKLGAVGDLGCFSFQVTKNLPSGEGGAVLTDDEVLAEKVYRCHNNCRGRRTDSFDFSYGVGRAVNHRMTELQGAILCAQIKHIEKYQATRNENGLYLNKLLADIPGVFPAKIYDGGVNAWHLYMFRIEPATFGIDRNLLLRALNAERISCFGGYGHGNWIEFVRRAYDTPAGKRVYPKSVLDNWAERVGALPQHHKLCDNAVWFTQDMLIGSKQNMDIIADGVRRIQKNAAEIARM